MKLKTEATLIKHKATNKEDEMISTMSKHKFKAIVKESVKKKPFDDWREHIQKWTT